MILNKKCSQKCLIFILVILIFFPISCYSQNSIDINIGYPLGFYELFGNVKKVYYLKVEQFSFKDQEWVLDSSESSGFYGSYCLEFNKNGFQISWIGKDDRNKGVLNYILDSNGDLSGYKPDSNYLNSEFFPVLNSGRYQEYNLAGNIWRILQFERTNIYDAWNKAKDDEGINIFHYRSSKRSMDSFIDIIQKVESRYFEDPLRASFDHIFFYNQNGNIVNIQYPEGETLTFDSKGRIIKRSDLRNYSNETYIIKSPESHIRTFNFAGDNYSVEYNFILDNFGNWEEKTVITNRKKDNWIERKRITRSIEYY